MKMNRAQPLFMHLRQKFAAVILLPMALAFGLPMPSAHAVDYNVLQECMKLSSVDDEINDCLDNYLDLMDDNMHDLTTYIARDLPDAALDQFQLSQEAFLDYRKQNCLWYLEFSSPRPLAEKIAKNCLSTMSQDRLSELQALIATDRGKADTLRGFYVYGTNRNSFQPCGSGQRYWVEGDSEQVEQLQQDYLGLATSPQQALYVELRGQLDSAQSNTDHSGSVQLAAVSQIKLPSDSECSLPDGATATTLAQQPEVKPPAVPEPETVQAEAIQPEVEVEDSDQLLRAYFGEWLAECKQNKSNNYSCDLSVDFQGDGVNDKNTPQLTMERRADKRTFVSLKFPDREIDSPSKIRWRVDKYVFGDIVGSKIRVDEIGTRQLVREKKFIRDDLMPLFKDGTEVGIEVLSSVDDNKGDRFEASLQGLTRALNFADKFVANGGKL